MRTLSLITACLLMAAPAAAKPTLVVAPLQSDPEDARDARTLSRFLRTTVGQTNAYTLVTPEDMGAIDEELKRQLSGGCAATSCIADIGGALGAQFMITGSLDRLGRRYILNLKLIDIEQVKAVNTTSIRAKNIEVIPGLLESKVFILLGAEFTPGQVPQASGPVIHGEEIAPELGWLSVTGKPTGASVTLTGPSGYKRIFELRKGQPFMDRVPPGTYRWTASLNGFGDESGSIMVKVDETVAVNIRLKPLGSLRITGNPNGAKVVVTGPNNFFAERGLPLSINRLRLGTYEVTVSRAGYITKSGKVSVQEGQKNHVTVNLSKTKESVLVRKQKTNNFSKILSRKFKWKLFQISSGDWRPGYSRGPYWSRLAINAQSKADQFMQCLSNSPDDILRKLIYSKAHSKPVRWIHPNINPNEHPTLFVNNVYNRYQKPHFQALKIDDMTIYRPGKDGAKHHVLGENAVDCLDSLVRDLDNENMIFVLEKTQAQSPRNMPPKHAQRSNQTSYGPLIFASSAIIVLSIIVATLTTF